MSKQQRKLLKKSILRNAEIPLKNKLERAVEINSQGKEEPFRSNLNREVKIALILAL